MLKLFYAPGTCALASHIVLEEAGAEYEAVRVDFTTNEQRKPEYLAVNPKGRVPALVTERGVLTETPAILAFVAQRYPQARLPVGGRPGRDCRDATQGAGGHRGVLRPGPKRAFQGAVGDGRCVHSLRPIPVYRIAMAGERWCGRRPPATTSRAQRAHGATTRCCNRACTGVRLARSAC